MIFRIADCAYRTKVLPGNRATDGEKKAGPRKEGRPCVILCWHVRAASRTCRSAMRRFGKLLPFRLFRRLYLHRASLPRASAYGGIASIVSIRGEASAEPVTQGTKKQIAAPSCRNLLLSILAISAVLFHFLEIDVGHIIVAGRLRLSSAGSRSACSRSGLGPCVRTLLGVLLGVIHILRSRLPCIVELGRRAVDVGQVLSLVGVLQLAERRVDRSPLVGRESCRRTL